MVLSRYYSNGGSLVRGFERRVERTSECAKGIRWRCLAGFLVLSSPLHAQTLYFEVTATHLPDVVGRCMDAAHGDVDADGDLDIALAMEFEPNILLINDGAGMFSRTVLAFPNRRHDSEEVDLADFDGDDDPDLLFVSEDDETNELYLNDGTGAFTDASGRITVGDVSNSHAVLDLDNDGDLDILTGNIGVNRVLINDGTAHFTDETDSRWPNDARTQDIELADVDGDGDLDVVTANEGQNELFINNGRGVLTLRPDGLPQRDDESREIRAADADGDSDLDLFVANVSFLSQGSSADYLLLNDGNGHFTDAPQDMLPTSESDHFTIQAADLDGDGDVDVILPHSEITGPGGFVATLANDGSGRFSLSTHDWFGVDYFRGNTFDIDAADFTGDGQPDLFFCNRLAGQLTDDTREDGTSRLFLRASE